MLLTGTCTAALWCMSLVTCRFRAPPVAAPADNTLVGSSDRPEGFRRRGAVTRLGAAPPALVLANSRLPFPSMEVMGNAPPAARAGNKVKANNELQ